MTSALALAEPLRYLAAEIVVDRAEFHRDQRPNGDAKLMGLISHGWAREQDGRVALTRTGRAALADVPGSAE
jgi:ketopantoate reductase